MNVAFLYNFIDENEWGTPFSIKSSFNKLGHTTNLYKLDPNNCNLSQLIDNAEKYDFVVAFYAGESLSFDNELKKLYDSKKTKILLELGDEPQTMLNGCNKNRINSAHLIFTPDYRCHLHYKENGYNSIWLTHWCDEDVFYYNSNINCENKIITTCGHRPCVKELEYIFKEKFVNKKIEGFENNNFYNSGSIVFQFARFDEITRRIMEAGGCKKAILVNRISSETKIYELFEEDIDIAYFSSIEECIEKATKLLYDSDYRNKLSNNIYKKITENHLAMHRAKSLIDEYSKL
jgi:hypothetical protein